MATLLTKWPTLGHIGLFKTFRPAGATINYVTTDTFVKVVDCKTKDLLFLYLSKCGPAPSKHVTS